MSIWDGHRDGGFGVVCFLSASLILLLFLLHLKIEAVNQISVKTPCLVSPLLVLVNGLLVFAVFLSGTLVTFFAPPI